MKQNLLKQINFLILFISIIYKSCDFTQGDCICKEYYCGGIIASSYPFIYGPQDAIDKLNEKLGFEMDGSIDCSLISSLPCKLKLLNTLLL